MDTPLHEPHMADTDPGYRQMPANEDAEQALLGAILINNDAIDRVTDFLQPDHFFIPVNGRIYEACRQFRMENRAADPVTLRDFFAGDPDLESVGGAGYLIDLASGIISVVNAEDYGRIIYDLHIRRTLITIGEDMVNQAYAHDLGISAHDQLDGAEQRLFHVSQEGTDRRDLRDFGSVIAITIDEAAQAMNRDTRLTGVTTGLAEMDKRLGGLQRSDLLILAARPAMGKSALAANIAFNAAKAFRDTDGREGARAAFFSLEMSSEQLALRILSDQAEIPSEKIRKGEIGRDDYLKLAQASHDLSTVPLYLDDTAGLTIGQLRTRARRLFGQSYRKDMTEGGKPPAGLIIVDYLQLMRPGAGDRTDSRVQEISEITRGLKMIAKDLSVPVIALSQLSRAVEQRDDKRPQLADLRESGSIEQDADVVMFIYREEYYLGRGAPEEGTEEHIQWQEKMAKAYNKAEVIIGKQRHGPTGTVNLFFDGRFTRFADLDQVHTDGF